MVMISRREKKPFKQYKPTNVTMQKNTHTEKKINIENTFVIQWKPTITHITVENKTQTEIFKLILTNKTDSTNKSQRNLLYWEKN